jgi:dipeptidyl-peptidase-3
VIEKITRNGKTYFNITDYDKLHSLFGELLRETQRIKSEGDYNAARNLVENYGVKVDQDIHKEVLARNARFKEAPYRGFVNPYITPVKNASGTVTDYILKYPESFAEKMLRYSKEYSFLPDQN